MRRYLSMISTAIGSALFYACAAATPAEKLGVLPSFVEHEGKCYTTVKGMNRLVEAQVLESNVDPVITSIEELCLRADKVFGNKNGVAEDHETERILEQAKILVIKYQK